MYQTTPKMLTMSAAKPHSKISQNKAAGSFGPTKAKTINTMATIIPTMLPINPIMHLILRSRSMVFDALLSYIYGKWASGMV